MMQQGALKEVQELAARNLPDSLPAMRALGVQELKAFLNGQTSLEEAVELAKLHTRQYAKRQSTWFNNRFSPDLVFPVASKRPPRPADFRRTMPNLTSLRRTVPPTATLN